MLGVQSVGVANHAKQGLILRLTIDGELRVENLVATVLAVGLGEHHQLHLSGVAFQGLKRLDQVLDLIAGQGPTVLHIGHLQGLLSLAQNRNAKGFGGSQVLETSLDVQGLGEHALGHGVVDAVYHRSCMGPALVKRLTCAHGWLFKTQAVACEAFNSLHVQATVFSNVGGFG